MLQEQKLLQKHCASLGSTYSQFQIKNINFSVVLLLGPQEIMAIKTTEKKSLCEGDMQGKYALYHPCACNYLPLKYLDGKTVT